MTGRVCPRPEHGGDSARRVLYFRYNPFETRRDGRVAEGGGLLNRCRVKSSTGGSNPPLSAIESTCL